VTSASTEPVKPAPAGKAVSPPEEGDNFSLFAQEEQTLRDAEVVIGQLSSASTAVRKLADSYRQTYREQRRMLRISDRMQLDLQKANHTLQEQAQQLNLLNAALKTEITQREALAHELHILATTDSLTQTCTRRQWISLAEQALEKATLAKECFAVAMLDIDLFKAINDQYGHAGGDGVLKHFSEQARKHFVGKPIGRLGGEEFGVMMPNCDAAQAEELAQNFCRMIAGSPTVLQGARIYATVSIGIACFAAAASAEQVSLEKLLLRADRALYSSKKSGRNRVTVDR
jgi:diguanylate cyclase (GGDEF)-like protein